MKLNVFGWIGIIVGCLGGLAGMVVGIIADPVFGTIFSVIFISIFGGVFWSVLFKPMMIRRRLEKNGVPAAAKIVQLNDTGVTVNNSPQVKLLLEVSSPVGGTYMVETKQIISRLQIPLFQPGTVLPVIIDPNDKNLITLDYSNSSNTNYNSKTHDVNNVPVGPWAGLNKQEAESRLWEIDRLNKEIMETGVSAKAIVTKYTWLGIYVNGNNPAAELELQVLPADRPAFRW